MQDELGSSENARQWNKVHGESERVSFKQVKEQAEKPIPRKIAAEMREAREADGARKFIRSEWLTKNWVQSYFSRLSAVKRRRAVTITKSDLLIQYYLMDTIFAIMLTTTR